MATHPAPGAPPKKDAAIQLNVDPFFSGIYVIQRTFQARLHNGQFPSDFDSEDKMEYIRTQFLALADEQHEALSETGWKPWAKSNHINREAYRGELADTFIFLMNEMIVASITPSELMEVVRAKQIVNAKRQDDGYDGVTTKCPGCKRAYDDPAVKCDPITSQEGVFRPNENSADDIAGFCVEMDGYVNKLGVLV